MVTIKVEVHTKKQIQQAKGNASADYNAKWASLKLLSNKFKYQIPNWILIDVTNDSFRHLILKKKK